jgi:molybdopterin molybdotransferase
LAAAAGRVLARSVASPGALPACDNSAMDGYAVRYAAVATVPVTLRVAGEAAAGCAAGPQAGPGDCVRIMTGAPLPAGADTVVPLEDTDGGRDRVTVLVRPERPGAFVRPAGDALAAGGLLAGAGTSLSPAVIMALAAAGLSAVDVRPRPRVAVRSTGDELRPPGVPLGRGQVYDATSLALQAALGRDGALPVVFDPAPDDPAGLAAWLDGVAGQVDLVLLAGGASVGDHDVTRDVLMTRPDSAFRHVRIQPGKPQGWARWDQGTPVLALPGNPLSTLTSYELFVRPVLDALLGRPPADAWCAVRADAAWPSPAGRRQIVPVTWRTDGDGARWVRPAHAKPLASHLVTALATADGLAMVPEDWTEVVRGDTLMARRLG